MDTRFFDTFCSKRTQNETQKNTIKTLVWNKIYTFFLTAANAVAKFMVVVVLPTPPFWLATDKIRVVFLKPASLELVINQI